MEQNSIWIIGIVTLAVGALIGYLIGRTGNSAGKQQQLIDQLNESQRELGEYKEQVNGHFEKTAELVNNLTESYKAVHQHLAQGSESLCLGEHAPAQLENSEQPRIEEQQGTATEEEQIPTVTDQVADSTEEAVVEPPRDYAPKNPDEEGTLSESFGLKKEADADQSDEAPTALKDHVPGNALKDEDHKQSA